MKYVPILKCNKGELSALNFLHEESKKSIVPYFVLSKPDKREKKILDINKKWKNKPFYLGFYHKNISNERIKWLWENSLNYKPVIFPDTPTSLIAEIKKYPKPAGGFAIHLLPRHYIYKQEIENIISELDPTRQTHIDVIIDAGRLLNEDVSHNVNNIVKVIQSLEDIAFHKIIITGSSFPESFTSSSFPENKRTPIPIIEATIYDALRLTYKNAIYSDYGSDDPNEAYGGPNKGFIPAIRYTNGYSWYIFRGSSDPRSPHSFERYKALSQKVVTFGRFEGASFSYGDHYIYNCANGGACGGHTEWVIVAMNHHFEYIIATS